MSKNSLAYRRNVAAFVLDHLGRILICERLDVADAWQLPQGGVEDGESPLEAVYRELREEIGTSAVEVITQLPTPICYEWPQSLWERGYRGQEQEYFLVHLRDGAQIELSSHLATPEFRSYKWVTALEFEKMVSGFKREAYLQALESFKKLFPDLIREHD